MSINEQPLGALERSEQVFISAVIAIPICNERDRIGACLDALAGQVGMLPGSFGLLLFLNNCTDGTRELVDDFVRASAWPVRVLERDFAGASAGWARRVAMQAAADWLENIGASDGALLTTDADSRVGPDWVFRNLAALANGAHAVAGRIVFEPAELAQWPKALRARQRLEEVYEALLAEIDARLDPQPGNPWPSHWTKSGATIAVRLSAFRNIGGVPVVASGEDHALIDAVRARGLVVRHDPTIVVATSSRLLGRARDGVADTLKTRGEVPESACAPRLERLERAVFRILRQRGGRPGDRGQTPALPFRPVRPAELPRQILRARLLLRLIRHLPSRKTSMRYAALRVPPVRTAQAAACRKRSVASSPVEG